MECFREEMDKVVTEAKHNVSSYIDNKIHSFGLHALKKDIDIKIEKE